MLEKDSARSTTGQAMIMAVMAIGATILGATLVAGLLVFYQLRQTTDLANSGKAIFAADSGLEWALYQFFQKSSSTGPTPLPSFTNGATIPLINCYDDLGNLIDGTSHPRDVNFCGDASTTVVVTQGLASEASRSFRLDIPAVLIPPQ